MKRGFTLMEMLVVCAIIVMMITVVLANTHNIGLEARVKATEGKIIDTAKDTRNRSVAVKEFRASVFPSYGVSFDISAPRQIIVYADCLADDNDDGIVNNLDTFKYISTSLVCGPGGTLVQTVSLDQNTKISAIRATYPVGSTLQTSMESKVDILFLRPEPTMWITTSSGGLISAGEIDIDITDNAGTFLRTVQIFSSGELTGK